MASQRSLFLFLAYSRPNRLVSALLALAIVSHSLCSTAYGAEKKLPDKAVESQRIPVTPSAPPQLRPKGPADVYRCQRYFLYDGKTYGCDSNIGQDAERLRPILEAVPDAVAELDRYQANRGRIRTAAYVGTAGLVAMALGTLISARFFENGTPTDTSNLIRNASLIGGAGIMVGSFAYALSYGTENERHLGRAVEIYNNARPHKPIELQFSTQLQF